VCAHFSDCFVSVSSACFLSSSFTTRHKVAALGTGWDLDELAGLRAAEMDGCVPKTAVASFCPSFSSAVYLLFGPAWLCFPIEEAQDADR